MNRNRFGSTLLIICAALLMGSSLFAGRVVQAQDQKPSSAEEQKQRQESLKNYKRIMLDSIPSAPSEFMGTRTDLSTFIAEVSLDLELPPIKIHPDVNARGTVYLLHYEPITKEDLFSIYKIVLKLNNAALIKYEGIYQIVCISPSLCAKGHCEFINEIPAPERSPANIAAQKQSASLPERDKGTREAVSPSAKDVTVKATKPPRFATYVVQVKSFPVKDMIEQLKPFMTVGPVITSFESMNMLIFTDYPESAARIWNIIYYFENNSNSMDSLPGR